MNFNQIKFTKPFIYIDGIRSYLKGAMVWGFKSKFKWSQPSTDIWGFANPNDIDPEAQAVYDRIIADGGVSNLIRLNYFVVGLKTIYGSLANVPVCYDAHWIGYKLGSGTGATAGQAVAKLYTISVIQSVSDSDAQAFIYRVYNAGGELTNTEATAVNQLTIDMKAAGIWTSMKAVYPMVGASAAACAQNLKSSLFTGTFTSGWTFASTGVTGNGTSAYMNTACAPNNMAQNSLSGFVYNRTDNLQITLNGCTNFEINDFDPNRSLYGAVNNSELPIGTQTTTAGFWGVSRISSAGWAAYKNGTNIVNKTQGSVAPSTNAVFIASRNTGTPTTFGNKEVAFFCIGDGLSDTQASNFYTAVQTFQVTLNRNV